MWDAEDSSHPQVSEMSKGHKHGIQSVVSSLLLQTNTDCGGIFPGYTLLFSYSL